MAKAGLLVATAVAALLANSASAGTNSAPRVAKVRPGLTMLWNQNSPDVGGADSQNFTSGSFPNYDSAGADDFVVPAGQTWTINEVDVSGFYYTGSGPSASENITFYKNQKGKRGGIDTPGKLVKYGTFTDLHCTENNGSFSCMLPGQGNKDKHYPTLKAGHYWVSFVVNCTFNGGCGEWWWGSTGSINNDAAEWEDPGGGWPVCPTWNTMSNCWQWPYDFAFDLQGSSN